MRARSQPDGLYGWHRQGRISQPSQLSPRDRCLLSHSSLNFMLRYFVTLCWLFFLNTIRILLFFSLLTLTRLCAQGDSISRKQVTSLSLSFSLLSFFYTLIARLYVALYRIQNCLYALERISPERCMNTASIGHFYHFMFSLFVNFFIFIFLLSILSHRAGIINK